MQPSMFLSCFFSLGLSDVLVIPVVCIHAIYMYRIPVFWYVLINNSDKPSLLLLLITVHFLQSEKATHVEKQKHACVLYIYI